MNKQIITGMCLKTSNTFCKSKSEENPQPLKKTFYVKIMFDN